MPPADTTGFYDVTRRVRQQGHVACALQGRREHPLILGTGPSLAPGVDLAPVGDETGKQLDVFVVDFLDLVYGEIADLAPRNVTRPAASSASSRAAGPSSGPLWRAVPSVRGCRSLLRRASLFLYHVLPLLLPPSAGAQNGKSSGSTPPAAAPTGSSSLGPPGARSKKRTVLATISFLVRVPPSWPSQL